MSSEWVHRFRQVALTVDYVDENIIDDIRELPQRYFEETLETRYFRFLSEGPGMETPHGESNSRPAIAVPLRYGERVYGVMQLEFRDAIPASAKARRFILTIAGAIGRVASRSAWTT